MAGTPSKKGRNVLIRRMRKSDYDDLVALWMASGLPFRPDGRDSRENVMKEIGSRSTDFLIAERDGDIIGAALCTNDGRKGWINRLAVLPECQHQGIASKLIAEAERRFEERGLTVVACLIHDDNSGSRALFERMGYELDRSVLYYSKRKNKDV